MKDNEKNLYEVSFLAKSDSGAVAVSGYLTSAGAEIVSEDELKKVKLAYPIKGEESATFGSIKCRISKEGILSVEHEAGLNKEILRTMIVVSLPVSASEGRGIGRRTGAEEEAAEASTTTKRSKREKADEVLSNELLEEKLEEILQ